MPTAIEKLSSRVEALERAAEPAPAADAEALSVGSPAPEPAPEPAALTRRGAEAVRAVRLDSEGAPAGCRVYRLMSRVQGAGAWVPVHVGDEVRVGGSVEVVSAVRGGHNGHGAVVVETRAKPKGKA